MRFLFDYSFIVAFLFVAFNSLCLIAYLPQVIKMLKEQQARQSVCLTMWGTWCLGAGIEFLYAVDISNTPWMLMALGHFVACLIVLSIGLYGMREKKKEQIAVSSFSSPITTLVVENQPSRVAR